MNPIPEVSGSGTYVLTLIFGAAALLLWGIRMARTGVMRAHGPQIRRVMPKTLRNRFVAMLTGIGAATVLQSSTAVAIFIGSLAGLGAVPVTGGLAIMLGADVGSAVVAALLTLNLKGIWPVLIFVGYVVHSIYSESTSKGKQYGRIALGLGLVLIALTFMAQVSGELANSYTIMLIVSSLSDEPILAILVLAVLTWLAHSSIAILLFWASLVHTGIIPDGSLIVAAVLGINLGGGIPAVVLTWGQSPVARRIILGNALFRLIGVLIGLLFLGQLTHLYGMLPGDLGFRVVLLHILFNLSLVVIFIGLLHPFARLLERFVPTPEAPVDEEFGPRYIPPTPGAFQAPLPLSALSRETLRLLDVVQSMLVQTLEILVSDGANADKCAQVRRLDDKVDTLYRAIRSYAIDLTRKSEIQGSDLKRVTGLLRYSANLENVGDIIDKSLLDITANKAKSRRSFSRDGHVELSKLFSYVFDTTQLAAEVIMSWRMDSADVLIERKRTFKSMVNESSDQHINRLRRGVSGSLETSSYHLDIIADLQRINALISSIAYDVVSYQEEKAETTPS